MKLGSVYEPGKYEADIYKSWEQSQLFTAKPHSPKPHFSISMPPPNETGTLHMGSALFVVLQDIMCRHARQQGQDVLWLPGTDHAALATDNLVEKRLAEQGTSKHQVGREAFITEVQSFVGDNRDRILSQLKSMGASCDWSRLRYTLDDTLNRCVNEVFVKMYKDGLIYRGHRIVNWDPKLETTVSDDEVIYKAETGPFYTLKYGPFAIGTARPETKFGDKYIVMHPADERYRQYKHGDSFEAQWINGPVKATIIKDEAIDPAFGTGVMTITPWHDHTDFEIAERHGLEKTPIIGLDGRLLPIAGEFAGQAIAEARPKIVQKLRAKGLLVSEEAYGHNIALNDRGGGVIEPQIMLQWFVDVNRPAVQWQGQLRSLREVMRAVIEDGDIKIVPKRFEKIYFHWIDNLRDWCISRQIWWGHRIPVWYKNDKLHVGLQPPAGQGWSQDPDTLDTWFSSALWTWSTLINPALASDYSLNLEDLQKRSLDFKTYHPTSVMETGWDILFFWVARMILATTYATGQVPFKTVYLHGLVRHESGRKMSKSDPQTIIDPMEVIPIYGTDALRLALVSGVNAGQDMRLGRSRIIDNRNFCNKLWNIARYTEGVMGQTDLRPPEPVTPADHWILNKLSILTGALNRDIDNFRFAGAYQKLYHFVWDDLADWYIEANKAQPNVKLLCFVLAATLIVTHPFAPFITEVIWQQLGYGGGQLLAGVQTPAIPAADQAQAQAFAELQQIVIEARRLITALGVSRPKLYYRESAWLEEQGNLIGRLAGLGGVQAAEHGPIEGLRLISSRHQLWLDIDKHQTQAYQAKLAGQQTQQREIISRLKTRLADENYLKKAPPQLVDQTKQQLKQEQARLGKISQELNSLQAALEG